MRLPSYQDLSREQDKINNLPLDGSYLVAGPPGTGKTVMALYRAKMLAEEDRNAEVLMRSRVLAQYTAEAIEELEIDGSVSTFDAWLGRFYRRHFRRNAPSTDGRWSYDWAQMLAEFGAHPPERGSLPHLLVDEGQDINRNFYVLARHVSQHLTVFADENQRLLPENSTLDDIKAYGAFDDIKTLTRNYRNTKEIAALAAHFFTGTRTGIPKPPTRSGPKPEMRRHNNLHDTVDFIARYERNHPDSQIGVLVWRSRLRDSIYNRLCVAGRTRNSPQKYEGGNGRDAEVLDFSSPGITVLCYQSAKGLEFDTVFIPELQALVRDINSPEFRMEFYVLTSRARDELYLSYSGDGRPAVLDAFPKELLEWP